VKAFSPDLIHVFKPKGFSGTYGLLRLYFDGGDGQPMVLDCDDWEGWGGWNDVLDHHWIVKEFIDLEEKVLLRKMPVMTVASRALLNRAESVGRAGSQVFYVPNCISAERASRDDAVALQGADRKLRLGVPDVPLVFYAGHFEPAEDIMFFCRAVKQAADTHSLAVALLGDGPELPLVREFFVGTRIHVSYFGRVPFDTYADVLAASDLAVFPYFDNPVYRSKCSARILDYMSFGKAILTMAVGQNLEYLVHGHSAHMVPPGDEGAFRIGFEMLLHNPALRLRLGQNARDSLRKNFLWQGAAIQNCLKAYARVHPVQAEHRDRHA
jgi:glycosyltransferase involved in cell wall biosynthesis